MKSKLLQCVGGLSLAAMVLLAATPEKKPNPSEGARLNNLGSAYYEVGRFRDAQRAYEESLLLRRRLGDGESRDAARTLSNLGAVYLELRQVAKARATLEQAARAL